MFKKFFMIVTILGLSAAASAAEPKPRGGYFGIGAGVSGFDDGGAFSGFNVDDQDTAFSVFGGYKFLRYFSVEARYVTFGTFAVDTVDLESAVLSVNAVGIIPFGQSGWELFGQLGLGQVTVDISGFGDEDEDVGSAGLGIRFNATDTFALALQTDAYAWEDDSLGTTYDTAFVATQLTIQFTF